MGDMAVDAASRYDVPMLVLVLACMLASSVLSGIRPSLGWRNMAQQEANLVKTLQEISTDGDLDGEIKALKKSVSRRVAKGIPADRKRGRIRQIVTIRLGHFAFTTMFVAMAMLFNKLLQGEPVEVTELDVRATLLGIAFVLAFEVIMFLVYLVMDRWDVDSKAER